MTQTPPPDPSPPDPYQPQPPGAAPQPPPYGAPPPGGPQGYGAPPYGAMLVPDHPQATLALILGIVGIVVCGVVAPFAWVIGGRAVREIDESGGRLGGRSSANAGKILGIVGTAFLALGVLLVLGVLGIAIVGVSSSSGS